MVGRFLRRAPLASLKITYAFITAAFKTNAGLCRECFFSADLPEPTLRAHMASIAASCNVRLLDLKAMNASLPIPRPSADLASVRRRRRGGLRRRRRGAAGNRRLGNTKAVVLKRTAHDVMLDTRWEGGGESAGGMDGNLVKRARNALVAIAEDVVRRVVSSESTLFYPYSGWTRRRVTFSRFATRAPLLTSRGVRARLGPCLSFPKWNRRACSARRTASARP